MEFGKTTRLRDPDLRLPPDHASVARLAALGSRDGQRIYAGCPVWQDDGLARKVCPPGTPKARRRAAYARGFRTAEVNATGYGLVPATVREWAASVPAGFRFCPKFPRDITLARDLDAVHPLFESHCADLAAFGDRLGAVLLQFPEDFGPSRFPQLERLLALPRPAFPLALEVRHEAWFRDAAWTDRLAALSEAGGIALVITDSPGKRDVVHMRLTAPWIFIRFNAFDGAEADGRRLDEWAGRLAAWLGMGLREAYFFPHADPVDLSADLTVRFLETLRARTGLDLPIPRLYDDGEEPRLAL